jgi:hypothetical protein
MLGGLFSSSGKQPAEEVAKFPNPLAVCLVRIGTVSDTSFRLRLARQALTDLNHDDPQKYDQWTLKQLGTLLTMLQRKEAPHADAKADQFALEAINAALFETYEKLMGTTTQGPPLSSPDIAMSLAAADPRAHILYLFLHTRSFKNRYARANVPHPEAQPDDKSAITAAISSATALGLSQRATAYLVLIYCSMVRPLVHGGYARQLQIERQWLEHTAKVEPEVARFNVNHLMFDEMFKCMKSDDSISSFG